jgi:hypothetical protein
MSTPTGVASDEASIKLPTSCPYIGMASDPQTHVGIPDTRNYCHLVNPPMAVQISHQQESCLSSSFPNCAVYQTSGEGPFPGGILEDNKTPERGFALGLLGLRRAQAKASKQASSEVKSEPETGPKSVLKAESKSKPVPESKSEPLSEPAPALIPIAKSEPLPTTVPEPLPVTNSEPVLEPMHEPKFEPVSEMPPEPKYEPQPSPKIEPAPVAAAVPIAAAVDEDEELRMRLYNEAVSRYEQVSGAKKERKGLWIFMMIVALLVLAISVWGIYGRLQKQQYESRVQAELGYTISLATAVQDMGAAAEAWGTAASLLQAQQETSTAVVLSTATAGQLAILAQQTSQASTAMALTATPTLQVAVCRNITDASFEIISGPILNPSPGTIYRAGLARPQASWVVQNTGNCGWSQILLWSTSDNTIVQPIVKLNGQVVTPNATSSQALVRPGEQVEIVLEFPAIGAQRVKGDWVLVADGLTLVSQPHMEMTTTNWIVLAIVNTPRPTQRVKTGSGGGQTTPGVTPPPRDTPVPPVEPTPVR